MKDYADRVGYYLPRPSLRLRIRMMRRIIQIEKSVIRGTTIANEKNRQEFPLSLYRPYCRLLCFLLREVNKNKADVQDDLLRKVSLWALIYIFEQLNLIHILLNVSSKSFENHAKYMYEKFRRVCKRKAETRH